MIRWVTGYRWWFLSALAVTGVLMLSISGSWEKVCEPAQRIKQKMFELEEWISVMPAMAEPGRKTPDSTTAAQDIERLQDHVEITGSDQPQEPDSSQIKDVSGGNQVDETWDCAESAVQVQRSELVYTSVEDDYFKDAVFIGDSRTQGLYEYGGLEGMTTFYASTGLTVFRLFDSKIVEVPGQKEKMTIEQALSENQFQKIYLMIGINEMGTGDLDRFIEEYGKALLRLKELQPTAIIYLQAIMKVTTERSNQGDYITNPGIEERNAAIAALADNRETFFLDVNPLFCDSDGGMIADYTSDGVHLKAQYIPLWKEFLKQHAVVLD